MQDENGDKGEQNEMMKAIAGKNGLVHFHYRGGGIETVDHFMSVLASQKAATGSDKHNSVVDRFMPEHLTYDRVVKGFCQFILRMVFNQHSKGLF